MSTFEASEFSAVLDRVRNWPSESRIALARRILETLEGPGERAGESGATIEQPTRGWPVERVRGLLKSDRQAPDDEECRRIVEEERWKKYGA